MRTEATKGYPNLDSRSYISFLIAKFGKSYIQGKFMHKGKPLSDRGLERWTADTTFVGEESVRKNFIEKFEDTLRDCMGYGHKLQARSMVMKLASIVGCKILCCDYPASDKGSVEAECLDDLPAVAAYHAVLTNSKSTFSDIVAALETAKAELEENLDRWKKEHPEKG